MSGDAASLSCPICSHTGVFDSPDTLRDRLIHVSTNKILCPVCQEEICGLDKLTIHLFSHVKPLTLKSAVTERASFSTKDKPKGETHVQQKKPKALAKNKPPNYLPSAPVKYVKIYPKLPVISVNPLPIMDLPKNPLVDDNIIQSGDQLIVKTEPHLIPSNTTCNMCGLQFVDRNILKMHRCLIHNINDPSSESSTRYNCHLCSKNFKMRGSLMVHLRVAHYGFSSENSNNGNESRDNVDGKNTETSEKSLSFDRTDNKQWQCDVCKKYFTTKYFLKKHKRLHTGETPYACTQCNKTFTFQQSYHKHLLYHNDEKPHTCNYCGRAFKELSTLHNHQRIHTGEKPFACETCGKCFRQRVSYLVHRRIHTGVMPYKCTACDKSFRYKVSQRTHKCQVHPPGTVVRQTGELVEKLKKKHTISDPDCMDNKQIHGEIHFPEISEANAELARTGAKLSLEDMETETFRIFADTLNNETDSLASETLSPNLENEHETDQIFNTNIDELFSMNSRENDKNLPSPSDILRNLCLSTDEDFGSDPPIN